MPAIFNSRGDQGLVFSFGTHGDVYCPPRKRSRICGPCFVGGDSISKAKKPSIDALPDECLFEIFRRLPGGRERSASACVSKRWLTILSSVRISAPFVANFPTDKSSNRGVECISSTEGVLECDGYLTRCVEGKKATDLRLAAIAVGTSTRGGLGKLSIRGSNSVRGVTNNGLSAIAHCCPSLRALSLWNLHSVGDEGLFEISRNCHSLDKLDLSECSSISNTGLAAIAKSCPNLSSLMIESCPRIGDEGLQAIGRYCPKLQSVTIKDCPLVGDQGVASLVSSGSKVLSKVKLQGLDVTDYSVAVIGRYGNRITNLVLGGLQNVSQKGFWVMGNARGLHMLSTLAVTSCRGVTDLSLEALGKGCPNLKHVSIRKCCSVSDLGMVAFSKAASLLESLQLEECDRVTQMGFLNAISISNSTLKSVSLVKCLGIKDVRMDSPLFSPCQSLRSLSVRSCPGFGSASLALVGKLCPKLHSLDLSGLNGITDTCLIPLLESCETGLSKVNLSGCSNLSDEIVLALFRLHGRTLELVNLDGCKKITDASLVALVESCPLLNDLDVSRCSITDTGVAALARGLQPNLQILSLSGCSNVSDRSVPALEKLGRRLVGLNLQHCCSITSSKIEFLSENLWRCDILS
ncbi:EIN3-binding F-box protein 1-like isoform X2 [Henckelia pumila]|uniref:EIN3-binding F-box protein 1-like isoform X2 n=1 Tax=Henckelia pumila TaxID=405737 RepID=UPI003C6E92AE